MFEFQNNWDNLRPPPRGKLGRNEKPRNSPLISLRLALGGVTSNCSSLIWRIRNMARDFFVLFHSAASKSGLSYLMDFSLKHIPSYFIKFQVTFWNVYVQNIFTKTKTFQGKTTGQDLLDEIFKYINIIERAYFGLRYQDNDNQTVTTRYNTNKNSSLALTCCCTATRNN